jgi:hypothetical protein
MLTPVGRECFRYIRILAAEDYRRLINSSDNVAKALKYFKNVHTMVCQKIKDNVSKFKSFSAPENMICIFGAENVLDSVETYLSWQTTMHT